MSGLGLTFLRRGGQAHPTAGSDYIKFADAEVFRVLMEKGVSSDGVGITKEDAAKVTSIGTWFYKNTTIKEFTEFKFFTSVTQLNGGYQTGAFYNCSNLTTIALPPSLATINNYAFQDCSSLNSVEGLSNVSSLNGEGCFVGCPLADIAEIYMPNLTGKLYKRTFTSMNSPHKVVNLGRITAIERTGYKDTIFGNGCTFLRLPATIQSISYYAFHNLRNVEAFICDAETPPAISSSFNDTSAPIYVPDAVVDAYKAASGWSSYASRIKPLSEYQG